MTSPRPHSPNSQLVISALWLAFAPAVAIGFGRFAYALVLPAMKADLGWTYRQAGLLNTANALGYLAGAMLAAPALRRVSARGALLGGLAVAVLALAAEGLTRSYGLLLAARAIVGVAGAFTFIAATVLAAQLGKNEHDSALALGISVTGAGFGTVATGILVPMVLRGDAAQWPRAWWLMAGVGAVLLPFVIRQTRAHESSQTAKNSAPPFRFAMLHPVRIIIAAYFFFGAGYIAYMTFLVAYVRALNASAAMVSFIWTLLGAAMIASSVVWKSILARDGGGKTMALMGFLGAGMALLPLASAALPVLILSALGFGIATMPVFTAVSMLIRRHLEAARWSGAFAWSTVAFAGGQSVGPFASGALSDRFGLPASLVWTASLLCLGALLALRHAPIGETRSEVSPDAVSSGEISSHTSKIDRTLETL